MPEFTLGADPEFEVVDRNDRFVPAHLVISGRQTWEHGHRAHVGLDGASDTGELRVTPGGPGTLISSVSKLIDSLYGELGDQQNGYKVYAGSGLVVPLGGHIHFSREIRRTPELMSKLDSFITNPLNTVSDRTRRQRGNYGRPGETRDQPHGWEYRSPCSWIMHKDITRGVIYTAWGLAQAQLHNVLNVIDTPKELARWVRTGLDAGGKHKNAAYWIARLPKIVKRMRENNIKLEQVEVFQAWKKSPVPESVPAPARPQLKVLCNFNLEDYNMPMVRERYLEMEECDLPAPRAYTIQVIGARAGRSQGARNPNYVFIHSEIYKELYEDEYNRGSAAVQIQLDNDVSIWIKATELDSESLVLLSKELRTDPRLAAKALKYVVTRITEYKNMPPRDANNRGNMGDILKVIEEKKRYQRPVAQEVEAA